MHGESMGGGRRRRDERRGVTGSSSYVCSGRGRGNGEARRGTQVWPPTVAGLVFAMLCWCNSGALEDPGAVQHRRSGTDMLTGMYVRYLGPMRCGSEVRIAASYRARARRVRYAKLEVRE